MEAIIPIVERLGSLGILVLMVWRAPSIIASIKELVNSVAQTVSVLQDKQIVAYEKQQETERALMTVRFEAVERNMERLGLAVEASSRGVIEVLHRLDTLERGK